MNPERRAWEDQLVRDGYSEKQSKRMGRLVYPTPREAALMKAQAARRKSAAARREASQQIAEEQLATVTKIA
jgi:hypothetical protein